MFKTNRINSSGGEVGRALEASVGDTRFEFGLVQINFHFQRNCAEIPKISAINT